MLGTTVSTAFEEASCELDKVKGPDLLKNSQKIHPTRIQICRQTQHISPMSILIL